MIKNIKLFLTVLIILLSAFTPLNSYADSPLINLYKERNELSYLAKPDIASLVFYSDFDFSAGEQLYYNKDIKDLLKKIENANELYSQSNVSASYYECRRILREMKPNDFYYMYLAYKFTQMGFYSLSKEAFSKVSDNEIWASHTENIKTNLIPLFELRLPEEIFMSELLCDIKFNNLTEESVKKLIKSDKSLSNSDYGSYIKAVAYYTEKNHKKALSEIEKALSKNPDNIEYIKCKAEILIALENRREALKTLDLIDKSNIIFTETIRSVDKIKYYILSSSGKNENEDKYNLAYYFYLNKDYPRAVKELTALVSKGELKKPAELLGKIYFITGKAESAEKLYEKCITKNKKVPFAYKGLGDILLSQKNYGQAYEKYKTAYRYDKKNPEILTALVVTAAKTNAAEEKYKYLLKLKKIAPTNFRTLYLCSKLTGDKDNHVLKSALKYNPFYPEGWLDLTEYEYRKDNLKMAEEYVNTAAFVTTDNPRYFYYKSLVNSSKNDITTALEDIKHSKEFAKQKGYGSYEKL